MNPASGASQSKPQPVAMTKEEEGFVLLKILEHCQQQSVTLHTLGQQIFNLNLQQQQLVLQQQELTRVVQVLNTTVASIGLPVTPLRSTGAPTAPSFYSAMPGSTNTSSVSAASPACPSTSNAILFDPVRPMAPQMPQMPTSGVPTHSVTPPATGLSGRGQAPGPGRQPVSQHPTAAHQRAGAVAVPQPLSPENGGSVQLSGQPVIQDPRHKLAEAAPSELSRPTVPHNNPQGREALNVSGASLNSQSTSDFSAPSSRQVMPTDRTLLSNPSAHPLSTSTPTSSSTGYQALPYPMSTHNPSDSVNRSYRSDGPSSSTSLPGSSPSTRHRSSHHHHHRSSSSSHRHHRSRSSADGSAPRTNTPSSDFPPPPPPAALTTASQPTSARGPSPSTRTRNLFVGQAAEAHLASSTHTSTHNDPLPTSARFRDKSATLNSSNPTPYTEGAGHRQQSRIPAPLKGDGAIANPFDFEAGSYCVREVSDGHTDGIGSCLDNDSDLSPSLKNNIRQCCRKFRSDVRSFEDGSPSRPAASSASHRDRNPDGNTPPRGSRSFEK